METIIEVLRGKKTYIVGGLMVALGLIQGDQEMVMQGLGFIFLRQGVSKMAQ